MSESKRAKPTVVPDDWEKQVVRIDARISKETVQKLEELGLTSLREVDLKPVPRIIEDLYIYFESVVAFQEVYEARKKLVKNYVTKENLPPEDMESSRFYSSFKHWWILNRYDLDTHGRMELIGLFSTICEPALNVYIVTDNFSYAYHVMREQIITTAFDGAANA